ncbi:MAG TPA: hypothetical protein VN278_08075 [Methanosarcina sp.]|nr:hypothetical protein [Methanosarcina sp.]
MTPYDGFLLGVDFGFIQDMQILFAFQDEVDVGSENEEPYLSFCAGVSFGLSLRKESLARMEGIYNE